MKSFPYIALQSSNTFFIPRPSLEGTHIFLGFQFSQKSSIFGAVGSYAGLSTHCPPPMQYSYCFGCVFANLWKRVSPFSLWTPNPQKMQPVLCSFEHFSFPRPGTSASYSYPSLSVSTSLISPYTSQISNPFSTMYCNTSCSSQNDIG